MRKSKIWDLICKIGILIFILLFVKFMFFGGISFSGSKIFTDSLYEKLIEIDYMDADLRITNEADNKSIYQALSSLRLRKASPLDGRKEGGYMIRMVTKGETLSLVVFSNNIIINGRNYYCDQDICEIIRTMIIKNTDYYKNNLFTKEIYDTLIEIDCWIDNKKYVISDADSLETVYHYLSRLTLEDASVGYKPIREPMQITLITREATIPLGILSSVICYQNKMYYTDSTRDMIDLLAEYAR